jgi:hypothetical protein
LEEEQTTQWLKEEEQTTQWLKEEEQTTQWLKEKGTWFVTRVTRREPLVEQELPTLLEHLRSSPVFSASCYSICSFMICRSLLVGLLPEYINTTSNTSN